MEILYDIKDSLESWYTLRVSLPTSTDAYASTIHDAVSLSEYPTPLCFKEYCEFRLEHISTAKD